MKLRKTGKQDIVQIMSIINEAKEYLQSQNVNQWQDGYPNEETIESDIELSRSFVVEDEGEIIATAMLEVADDPTYQIIEGEWLNDQPYLVVHRIAVAEKCKAKGVAKFIIDEAIKLFDPTDIRMDTHEKNISMQRFLNKYGFKYCGIIYLENKDTRMAYHFTR